MKTIAGVNYSSRECRDIIHLDQFMEDEECYRIEELDVLHSTVSKLVEANALVYETDIDPNVPTAYGNFIDPLAGAYKRYCRTHRLEDFAIDAGKVNYWKLASEWFFSKRWSVLVAVIAILPPIILGWIQIIKWVFGIE